MILFTITETDSVQSFLDAAYAASFGPPYRGSTIAALHGGEIKGVAHMRGERALLAGDAAAVNALLLHGFGPSKVTLIMPLDHLALVETFYDFQTTAHMLRFSVVKGTLRTPATLVQTETIDDEEAVAALVKGLDSSGPIIGVRDAGKLATIGAVRQGTSALIDTVFTHPDYRRKGYGSQVVYDLANLRFETKLPTVYADCEQGNAPAAKMLKRLGFKLATQYIRAEARRF